MDLPSLNRVLEQTLEELEGDKWEDSPDDTSLVSRCAALRRKPLGELKTGDWRVLIGQNIGLRYLIPLALERLEANMFVEAEFYPGDLLGAVLNADRTFWLQSPRDLRRAQDLAARAVKRLRKLRTTEEIRAHLSASAEKLLALRLPAG